MKCKKCKKEIGDEVSNYHTKCWIEDNPNVVRNKLPENLVGHIIVFDEPLEIQTWKVIKTAGTLFADKDGCRTKTITEKKDKVVECHYMRAEGGFGCHRKCSGRMIIGDFFDTIENIKNNKPIESGNTKCFPDGYIPELYIKLDD